MMTNLISSKQVPRLLFAMFMLMLSKTICASKSTSGQRLISYLSLPLFPEFIGFNEMKEQTGHSRTTFDQVLQGAFPNGTRRQTIMSFEAQLFAVLQYYKKGGSFRDQAFNRGLRTHGQLHKNFWDWSVSMFRLDPACPHRNYDLPGFLRPTAEEVLRTYQTDCQFLKGMFSRVFGPNRVLNVFSFDHTYPEIGKLSSPTTQKQTYFMAKNLHCEKFGAMVNDKGKFVFYTPPSASNVPLNADGNLLALQAHYENNGVARRILGDLLLPQNNEFATVCNLDKGYTFNVGVDRGTNLSLHGIYNDPNNPSDNGRYLIPLNPGHPLLGPQLRYDQVNPVPPVVNRIRRTKLTCAEANNSRACTISRWACETAFGAVDQYRIVHGIIDTHFLGKIGSLLPEAPDCQKLEIIFSNIFCMLNRNHPGFRRCFGDVDLPPDITHHQLGEMAYARLYLLNEFDPFERVVFSENLQRMPTQASLLKDSGGWTMTTPNTPDDH